MRIATPWKPVAVVQGGDKLFSLYFNPLSFYSDLDSYKVNIKHWTYRWEKKKSFSFCFFLLEKRKIIYASFWWCKSPMKISTIIFILYIILFIMNIVVIMSIVNKFLKNLFIFFFCFEVCRKKKRSILCFVYRTAIHTCTICTEFFVFFFKDFCILQLLMTTSTKWWSEYLYTYVCKYIRDYEIFLSPSVCVSARMYVSWICSWSGLKQRRVKKWKNHGSASLAGLYLFHFYFYINLNLFKKNSVDIPSQVVLRSSIARITKLAREIKKSIRTKKLKKSSVRKQKSWSRD